MVYYLPIALVVLSNIFYHICSKAIPEKVNPFATLTVTYFVGAVVAAVIFFITSKGFNLIEEYRKINWASIVLGFSIVGLEAGYIYMYKVGWEASRGQLVQSAVLAICLVFIGYFMYKEQITVSKLVGVALCLCGIFFLNR